jgi:hypothetical protein
MSRAKVNCLIAAFVCTLSMAMRPVAVSMLHEMKTSPVSSGTCPASSSFQPREMVLIKAHIVDQAKDPSSIDIVEYSQPKLIKFRAPCKRSPVLDGHYTVVSVTWRYRNIFNGMSVQEKYFLLVGSKIVYRLDKNPDPSSVDALIKSELDKALVKVK